MPRAAIPASDTRRALILLPLAAIVTILPLLVHGCSCGQDQVFHLQSWLDAAAQLRHGHYPRWAFSPAYNAGEPRFLFYPPLSWLLGAALTLFPIAAAPALFTWIALTAAGLSFHRLARHFVSPNAALFAATLYLANPYMLFNAYERGAYAELLAATWIPLLFLAVLRVRPNLRGIALPIALLWLTNAPAAVMGCYTFALLATLRVMSAIVRRQPVKGIRDLALTYLSGAALGLALPAFYLVPAAWERRFVQVEMAIIPNMRFQDNFLFTRTSDADHNAVNHTASALALTVLLITVAVVSAILLSRKRVIAEPTPEQPRALPTTLATLTLLIAFLLVPISTPLWLHLPELAFLQFPWRLLTILSAVLCLGLALLFDKIPARLPIRKLVLAGPIVSLAVSLVCFHLYAQGCDPLSLPSFVANLLQTHHGVGPTDEYTPNDADNDLLRPDDPGFWLIPARDAHGDPANPSTPAPNTTPTPTELHPNILTDDLPFPANQTLSTPAPNRLQLNLPEPQILVLNLRDYPNWLLTRNTTEHPAHLQRDDGLIAIALPSGPSTLDIAWHRTPDQALGLALSGCALIALALTFRSRRINV